jgi:hypothetical protein
MTKTNPYLIGLASFLVTLLAIVPDQSQAAAPRPAAVATAAASLSV